MTSSQRCAMLSCTGKDVLITNLILKQKVVDNISRPFTLYYSIAFLYASNKSNAATKHIYTEYYKLRKLHISTKLMLLNPLRAYHSIYLVIKIGHVGCRRFIC